MTIGQTDKPTPPKPLRLWPGVVAVVLQWLARFVLPIVVPEAAIYAVLAGVVGGLVVFLWWLFFSRAPWSERVVAIFRYRETRPQTARNGQVSNRHTAPLLDHIEGARSPQFSTTLLTWVSPLCEGAVQRPVQSTGSAGG